MSRRESGSGEGGLLCAHAWGIWCFWGVALASLPCVMRSALIVFSESSALVAPLQFQTEPLALAFTALVLLRALFGDETFVCLAHLLCAWGPAVACASVVVVALCEVGWLFVRLGDFALFGRLPVFGLVGSGALAASIMCWTLYGAVLGPGEGAQEEGVPEESVRLRLFCGGFWVPLALLAIAMLLPVPGALVLSVVSGIFAWGVFRLLRSKRLGTFALLDCELALVGGLLAFSAYSGAIFEALLCCRVFSPDATPWVLALAVVAGLGFLALDVLLIRVSRDESQSFERSSGAVSEMPVWSRLKALPGADTLSDRQREVLLLRLEGVRVVDVSSRLGISVGTVSTFQRRALDALGFEGLADLSAALEDPCGGEAARRVVDRDACDRSRKGCATALPVALFLPLAGAVPFPYRGCALLLIGALLVTLSLASMIRGGKGFSGRELGGVALVEHALTCASAVSLGWSMSVGIGSIFDFARLELLVCLTVARLGWCPLGTGRGGRRGVKLLGCDARVPQPHLAILYLLAGSSILLQQTATFGSTYFVVLQPVVGLLSLGNFILWLSCVIGSVAFLVYRYHTVSRGRGVWSDASSLKVFDEQGLSETEAQVMLLVAKGYARSQIAARLHLAAGTVNGARATAYRKLGIHSTKDLRELLRKSVR